MLEKMLEFENQGKVLQFHYQFENTLVWPFIRQAIMRSAINKVVGVKRSKSPRIQTYKATFKHMWKNPINSSQKDIVFFCNNTDMIVDSKGKCINKHYDFYASCFENRTEILEEESFSNHTNRGFSNVRYMYLVDKILERTINEMEKDILDIQMSKKFITYLKEEFPIQMDNHFWQDICRIILYHSIRIKAMKKIYPLMFKRINPKIVFIESASYGGRNAYLVKLLRDMNIVTAEFQHAMICKTHESYNYSQIIYDSEEYRRYLPDYFMVYGEHFLNQIRLPVKKVVIGNIIFYSNREEWSKNTVMPDKKSKRVLLLPGIEHEPYVKLIHEILYLLQQEVNITIKLHPTEIRKGVFRKYSCFKGDSRVHIVTEGSVYVCIQNADCVIGDVTTAQIEARACGKLTLNLLTESSVFYGFDKIFEGYNISTGKDVLSFLTNDTMVKTSNEIEKIFSSEYEKNYKRFIKKVITDIYGKGNKERK